MTFNVCGTIQYLPPECILALGDKTLGYVGMPFDCWSVGVILYTMLAFVTLFFPEFVPLIRSGHAIPGDTTHSIMNPPWIHLNPMIPFHSYPRDQVHQKKSSNRRY
jgi:serine/threonine protein kinase